jgi:Domain of unknown function (DUF4259)
MGAWGSGIYENDDAADWVVELADSDIDYVVSALTDAVDAEYLEVEGGSHALAAADVVARLRSGIGDSASESDEVAAWVTTHAGAPGASLVDLALRAVAKVRGEDSELQELWAENEEGGGPWLATLADLDQRLSGSA